MKHILLLFLVIVLFQLNCNNKDDDDCKTWMPTPDYCILKNSGNSNCNGKYYSLVSQSEKKIYAGGDDNGYPFHIKWDPTYGWSLIDSDNNILYYINVNTSAPPSSSAWQVLNGTPPAPSSEYVPVLLLSLPCGM